MRNEFTTLHLYSRIRNVLLEAVMRHGRTARLREAAQRVMRLSDPGTPDRLLTLSAVAEDTGLSAGDIVAEIQRQKASSALAGASAPTIKDQE
jgi:hypothetical protein